MELILDLFPDSQFCRDSLCKCAHGVLDLIIFCFVSSKMKISAIGEKKRSITFEYNQELIEQNEIYISYGSEVKAKICLYHTMVLKCFYEGLIRKLLI